MSHLKKKAKVLTVDVTTDLSRAEKETVLEPFVLKDLLPSSLGSYYRYTGSLTMPPCSKVVEWIVFSRPIYVSYKQVRNRLSQHKARRKVIAVIAGNCGM